MCNRSFFPCFDTPAVKCTYSAVVKVGAHLCLLQGLLEGPSPLAWLGRGSLPTSSSLLPAWAVASDATGPHPRGSPPPTVQRDSSAERVAEAAVLMRALPRPE